MAEIVLNLPYPISANLYWRTAVRGGHAVTYVSKEAKDFIEQVGWIARAAGVRKPLECRLSVSLQLYPHRPKDWAGRVRKFGAAWSDTVQCIDLTNAEKVLLDALNAVAFVDDKQVFRYAAERMEPDEHGARCVVTIKPIAVDEPQKELL